MKKLILALLMSFILVFSMSISVLASAPDNEDSVGIDPKEHITFGPQTRINSDGTFTFYIHSQLNSNDFKVSASDVTLTSFAYLNDIQDNWISNQTCAYTVKMVKSGLWGNTLISLSCVTGSQSSGSTNSATTSDKYSLVISKSGGEGYYLDGKGTVSNFAGHV